MDEKASEVMAAHWRDPDYRAWNFYRRGYNTMAIAHMMKLSEAEADRLLSRAMDKRRRRPNDRA